MTIYEIPVTYKSGGIVEVEANSFEEACELCLDGSLPYNSEYIENSIEIDYDSLDFIKIEAE